MSEERSVIREKEIRIEGLTSEENGERAKVTISNIWGVASVDVYLSHNKALVKYDANRVALEQIYTSITEAGFRVLKEADKSGFWRKIKTTLKDLKAEMEKNSVAHSNAQPISCCQPPEEAFTRKRKGYNNPSSG